ncbi:hypothetical protein CPC08DRAFT_396488 [Agrocybe pediades]|nr:hypothetical protein CPC08DRAFT_396488 [Agrocybe pediades]
MLTRLIHIPIQWHYQVVTDTGSMTQSDKISTLINFSTIITTDDSHQTSSGSPTAGGSTNHPSHSVPLIVGCIVGGIAVILLFLLFLLFYLRRQRRLATGHLHTTADSTPGDMLRCTHAITPFILGDTHRQSGIRSTASPFNSKPATTGLPSTRLPVYGEKHADQVFNETLLNSNTSAFPTDVNNVNIGASTNSALVVQHLNDQNVDNAPNTPSHSAQPARLSMSSHLAGTNDSPPPYQS